MKIHVDIRTAGGPLFCGTVKATSVLEALTIKLAECDELTRRPMAALSAQARPADALAGRSTGGKQV